MDARKRAKGRSQCFCRKDALNKAQEVFCTHGYAAASVAQLGEAMGMKPPSLYNAFGDKESLFIEVLKHYHTPYKEMVALRFAEAKTTKEAIQSLFDLAKGFHMKKEAQGCLLVNSTINVCGTPSAIAQTIKDLHNLNEEMIYNRLKQDRENGDFSSKANIRAISRYINGVLQGTAILARGQQSPTAVRDLLEQGLESAFFKINKP